MALGCRLHLSHMRYAFIVGLVLGGVYIFATQMVLNELRGIAYYYQNAEQIADNIAQSAK